MKSRQRRRGQVPRKIRGGVLSAHPPQVAVTGWFSFPDGEATAGDLLALQAVQDALDRARIAYDVLWSPGFRPGAAALADLPVPAPHAHLVFVCGPAHGAQVERLHTLFADSTRIAVGVSVVDAESPAVAGFHHVLARDGPGVPAAVDLAAGAPQSPPVPVAGVVLTTGQREYGARRRHGDVARAVVGRLRGKDAALLPLDTRASTAEWHLPSTAAQLEAILRRLDLVVTTRLHGLVLALRCAVPALAVDPVAGGAKVSAQAAALRWPAVLAAGAAGSADFDHWWQWCLSAQGRDLARLRAQEIASAGAFGTPPGPPGAFGAAGASGPARPSATHALLGLLDAAVPGTPAAPHRQ